MLILFAKNLFLPKVARKMNMLGATVLRAAQPSRRIAVPHSSQVPKVQTLPAKLSTSVAGRRLQIRHRSFSRRSTSPPRPAVPVVLASILHRHGAEIRPSLD